MRIDGVTVPRAIATPGPATPLRIAVAGFMHETNTFVPRPTTLADFALDQAYPGLCRGDAMRDRLRGRNLAAEGFRAVAEAAGHRVMPVLWTFAQPGGIVTAEAFETIAAELVHGIAVARPDAVFLELHGAMVSERFEDGEGELLARVRAVVGPDVPILASLDLHGNISAASVACASLMTAYRTYPHVDWGETGARAARLLPAVRRWGAGRATAFRRFDALIPVIAQCTLVEPAAALYRLLEALEAEHDVALSLMMGFPPADIPEAGPTIFGYGADAATVEMAVDRLDEAFRQAEPAFAAHRALPAAEAVREALALAATASRPIVIADAQDNAGAGASSSTTGMAAELLRQGARRAIVLIAHEPGAARAAHAAGVGGTVDAVLGRNVDGPGQEPLPGPWRVVALSDGRFAGTGPMLGGAPQDLGPTAVLEREGVQVLLGSKRQQPLSRNTIAHLGLDPAAYAIVVVKSSVHFRNDFQDFAERVIIAASPGANPLDRSALPYRRIPSARLRPLRTA